jgi:hypothetical protein
VRFDIDRFAEIGGRLDTEGLDIEDAFRAQPLDPEALACLRYMHDIESHTVCYLRDVLVTKAHGDPELTTFLTIWNYEEHWHGEALGRVLAAHGEQAGAGRISDTRLQLGRWHRLRPLAFMIGSSVLPDITATSMAWGAVNEWTTQAGYARLIEKAQHPVLTQLLKRIMKQEGRHIDFYASQATRRLGSSRASQRVTRTALRRVWGPVGTGVRPEEEVASVVRYLFGDGNGAKAAARIDRQVDRLPGLTGLDLVTTARTKYLAPA